MSTERKIGPSPTAAAARSTTAVDAELADLVHEDAGDPALGLPAELLLARPVAAQADLDVAGRVDVALLDQAPHRRPVRDLDPEDLGAGVGVGVEVDEADRAAAVRGAGADVGLGDAVVAAEDDRDRAGIEDLADGALDRRVAGGRVGGQDRGVAEVDDPQRREAVDPASRCGPGGQLAARIARGPKRAPGRSETRSSVGAPTIATSAPASSAGSSV